MSFTAPAAHHPAVPPFHTRGTTPRTQPYTGYLWRHLARPASQSYPANVPAGQPLRRRRGAAGCRERAGVSTKRLVAGGAPCLSPPASCLQEGVPAPRRPVGGLGGPARGGGGGTPLRWCSLRGCRRPPQRLCVFAWVASPTPPGCGSRVSVCIYNEVLYHVSPGGNETGRPGMRADH